MAGLVAAVTTRSPASPPDATPPQPKDHKLPPGRCLTRVQKQALKPDGPFDSGVIQSFCHFVHFFASRQAGQQWAAGHPRTFLLTLGEAADLAARANQRMFPDALGAR